MSELTDQETAETTAVDEDTTTVAASDTTETADVEQSNQNPEAEESDTESAIEDKRDTAAPKDAPADLEKEGEVAADFLENLLDICDLDGDIDVDIDGDRAAVAIVDSEEGRVPRRLVGDNAKVLDALQELTRLAVQAATGHRSRLMLDVAGHRAGRRAELVEVAKVAIASVKESGEKTALDPMTAFERKVVHDEVLAAGLSSESEGVEPRRHVVVLPA
ncbi:putative Jag-like protein [Janibacter sp. HTCC2649]|uniref:Jag family protein n=1 Tax=Janibacter sp. HTCC2649 TaxID=313589 RepID=UPI0000671A73|nr:R3H domain-containing nucleic acid-binding protein [Janibacter sp. HTCC2649]EAP97969.1 putative Jag-like protein [Janibacter sp. HTCC2649]